MPLIQPSSETPAQRAAKRIRNQAVQGLRQLKILQRDGIRVFWNDKDATPQEIGDALGTDSEQAFLAHGILTKAVIDIATILGVNPEVLLPTNNFTFSPEGNITVGEGPFVPA